MNDAEHRFRQEIDRAREVKARYIKEAHEWVQTAKRELENAEACAARWEKAAPYEVLEHDANETKRRAECTEAEQYRKVFERDKKERVERALLTRGATNVATALFFTALLASAIAPFVLPEYAAKHLIAGVWASWIVSLPFCLG